MSLYLKSLKLDRETGDELEIVLNSEDAKEEGVNVGDIVSFQYADFQLFAQVEITDTEIQPGHVGLYEEMWVRYKIPSDQTVVISIIDRPESIEYIKRKLLGYPLDEHQLKVIAEDISQRKIREVEIAYFMATFFNPGFNDDEVLWLIKGMAGAGDILDFTNIRDNGTVVVDKHSIGGVAAKGITPLLVPIIASFDLVIPNTSTRAITTPAGTTDILELIMPVAISNDKVMEVVKKTSSCMIWGGALKLSPADDVLINIEKGLHVQSFQKMLVSIVAKKVSMGISHIVIDIPYGLGTKVENPDDVEVLKKGFIKMFDKVNIKCEVYTRHVTGPDGYGVGPALEVRDILRVYERHPERPRLLEETALDMAGMLLELVGKAAVGKGKQAAREKLDSGEALDKLWEIAMAQGATGRISSTEIKIGQYEHQLLSEASGKVELISNKEIVKIARALGNPFIKEAGIYFHKAVGDNIEVGEPIATIYAAGKDRLETGKAAADVKELVTIK